MALGHHDLNLDYSPQGTFSDRELSPKMKDATGLSRGASRSPLHASLKNPASMPRACPVELHVRRYTPA